MERVCTGIILALLGLASAQTQQPDKYITVRIVRHDTFPLAGAERADLFTLVDSKTGFTISATCEVEKTRKCPYFSSNVGPPLLVLRSGSTIRNLDKTENLRVLVERNLNCSRSMPDNDPGGRNKPECKGYDKFGTPIRTDK